MKNKEIIKYLREEIEKKRRLLDYNKKENDKLNYQIEMLETAICIIK